MRPAVVLLTAFLALALPAGAAALPGDPQIVALTPGNGEVVAANDDGIPVTFECPAYTIAVYSSGDVTITDRGDYSDYDVRFSSGPAVGPDGRLAEQPYGSDAGPALVPTGVRARPSSTPTAAPARRKSSVDGCSGRPTATATAALRATRWGQCARSWSGPR